MRLKKVDGVDDETVFRMTKRVVEGSKGGKDKCSMTFERNDDGTLDVTLPMDAPSWRRGDVESMKHSHERYSKVASRLQKKLMERGKTPNTLKTIL